MKKEKYGKSPAMADLPKVKADNKKVLAKLKKKALYDAFHAGFVSGVKNQQDFEKSHFFTFWRYW